MTIGVKALLLLALAASHAEAITLDELFAAGGHVGCFPAASLDDDSARAAALAVAAESAGVGQTSLVGREVEVTGDDADHEHVNLSGTTVVSAAVLSNMQVLTEGRIGADYCVAAMFEN